MMDYIEVENFDVECIGEFEEDVYDIEVEDNHNFFGDGILLHNSNYLCLDELRESLGIKFKDNAEFREWANDLDQRFFKPFFEKILGIYAKNFGVDQGINFKREKIITKKIILAKKKYADLVVDDEGKISYKDGTLYTDKPKMSITGIEMVKSSTPSFCVEHLESTLRLILDHKDKEMTIDRLRDIYKEYKETCIENISRVSSINNYSKYGLDTSIYLEHGGVSFPSGCPQHVKASINYNYLVAKYKLPLQPIGNGTKIKFIKVKSCNEIDAEVIAYIGKYPKKFHEIFTIDKEEQWQKTFVQVVQRFYNVLDWGKVRLDSNNLSDFLEF